MRFGRGRKQKMKFGDFLDAIKSGSEQLYMTTQDMGADDEGRPHLMTAPLTQASQ
jgi:hypothetical protein